MRFQKNCDEAANFRRKSDSSKCAFLEVRMVINNSLGICESCRTLLDAIDIKSIERLVKELQAQSEQKKRFQLIGRKHGT